MPTSFYYHSKKLKHAKNNIPEEVKNNGMFFPSCFGAKREARTILLIWYEATRLLVNNIVLGKEKIHQTLFN